MGILIHYLLRKKNVYISHLVKNFLLQTKIMTTLEDINNDQLLHSYKIIAQFFPLDIIIKGTIYEKSQFCFSIIRDILLEQYDKILKNEYLIPKVKDQISILPIKKSIRYEILVNGNEIVRINKDDDCDTILLFRNNQYNILIYDDSIYEDRRMDKLEDQSNYEIYEEYSSDYDSDVSI